MRNLDDDLPITMLIPQAFLEDEKARAGLGEFLRGLLEDRYGPGAMDGCDWSLETVARIERRKPR